MAYLTVGSIDTHYPADAPSPMGWYPADGSTLNQADYPELFEVLSNDADNPVTHDDEAGTFNLPTATPDDPEPIPDDEGGGLREYQAIIRVRP